MGVPNGNSPESGDSDEYPPEDDELMAELGEWRNKSMPEQQSQPLPSPAHGLANRMAVGCISLFGQSVSLAMELGDNIVAASPWSESSLMNTFDFVIISSCLS